MTEIIEKGWDEKEQDGLREVEKILGRADEILEVRYARKRTPDSRHDCQQLSDVMGCQMCVSQEEENVLAQEAVLEALLSSEDRHWPLWDSKDQLSVVCSSDLEVLMVLI